MTDPPDNYSPDNYSPDSDGEVPERFLELIDEILADQSVQTPPSSLDERRAKSGMPARFFVYGAVAAAALVVAIIGVAALLESEISSVDTERAAIPTSPATSNTPPGVAGDATRQQIAADAEIAASFGLTLGPQVFADDGSFELADQPDLTPIIDDDTVVGYVFRRDIDPENEATRLVVYGPDGVTVRGVLDLRDGFVPTATPSTEPGD